MLFFCRCLLCFSCSSHFLLITCEHTERSLDRQTGFKHAQIYGTLKSALIGRSILNRLPQFRSGHHHRSIHARHSCRLRCSYCCATVQVRKSVVLALGSAVDTVPTTCVQVLGHLSIYLAACARRLFGNHHRRTAYVMLATSNARQIHSVRHNSGGFASAIIAPASPNGNKQPTNTCVCQGGPKEAVESVKEIERPKRQSYISDIATILLTWYTIQH